MSRPRIHWVSPLPPARTDIAEYTRRCLPALAARADLVLWTDAERWEPGLERPGIAVRRLDPAGALPLDLRSLPPPPPGGSEAVFFHIGNSWEFHSGILAAALRVPGVIVLHDLALREALRDMAANRLLAPGLVAATARAWYGAGAAARVQGLLAGQPVTAGTLAAEPLWELLLARATGVLCHTRPGYEAVAARGAVPAWELPLPFPAGPARAAERARTGPLRLVQFGHIGPNRRLEQVFEALAALGSAVDWRFEVFGRLWDPALLEGRARELGLADRVIFRGFAPEAELDAALARAHLVFNLRQPSMGEASGSQLRIWAASALAAVSDLGWYATLPEETVEKIAPDDERAGIAALLRRLDTDRNLAARKGTAGRARLEALHAPERYAAGIAAIAAEAPRDARDRLGSDALRRLLATAPDPGPMRPRAAETL
ncbi:MAG: glycosyltransferase family 1 protein [Pseudomonadota bacterium]